MVFISLVPFKPLTVCFILYLYLFIFHHSNGTVLNNSDTKICYISICLFNALNDKSEFFFISFIFSTVVNILHSFIAYFLNNLDCKIKFHGRADKKLDYMAPEIS